MTETLSDKDVAQAIYLAWMRDERWTAAHIHTDGKPIAYFWAEIAANALASRSIEREAEIRRAAIEECAKVADQEATALKSKIACNPYARSRVMYVAHRIRALAQQPPARETKR